MRLGRPGRAGTWSARRFLLAALAAPILTACGKKGPPQPIVHIVPTSPGVLSVRQIGDDVVLAAAIPGTRTDGTKLEADAELRVLRMPATDSLRPGSVSNRYLIIQFDKQAKTVASLNATALAPYVLGGRLMFIDHEALTAGSTPSSGATPGAKSGARHGASTGGSLSGHAATSGAAEAGAALAPRLPRWLYALQVVEPKGRKSMLRTPSMLEICHAPQTPVDLQLETAEGEVRLDWKTGTSPPGPAATSAAAGPTEGPGSAPASVPPPSEPPAQAPAASSASPPAVTPPEAPPPAAPAPTPPPQATGPLFNVYRRVKSETRDPETPLNPAPLDAPSFIDRAFQYDVEYVYFVRATGDKSQACESASSLPVEVKPHDRFAPSAPTGLAVNAEGDAIRVYWFPSSEADLGGYRVYRREGEATEAVFLADVPATETSYIDTGAKRGVRYHYSVSAVDTATPINESPRSEERSEMLSVAPGGAGPAGANPGGATPPGGR